MGQPFSNCMEDDDESSPNFHSAVSMGFDADIEGYGLEMSSYRNGGDVWLPDSNNKKKLEYDHSKEYEMTKIIDHERETDTTNMGNPKSRLMHIEKYKRDNAKDAHQLAHNENHKKPWGELVCKVKLKKYLA